MPRRTSKLSKSRRRVSKRRVSKRRVYNRQVSKRRVSKRRVSNRRVSRKQTTKRKQYRRRNKNLIGGMEETGMIEDTTNKRLRGDNEDENKDEVGLQLTKRHMFFTPSPSITYLKKLSGHTIQCVGIHPSRFEQTELDTWKSTIKDIFEGKWSPPPPHEMDVDAGEPVEDASDESYTFPPVDTPKKNKNPGNPDSEPLDGTELQAITSKLISSKESPNWYDKYYLLLLFSSWSEKEDSQARKGVEERAKEVAKALAVKKAIKQFEENGVQVPDEDIEAMATQNFDGAYLDERVEDFINSHPLSSEAFGFLKHLISQGQFKREKGSSPKKTTEGIFQQAVIKQTIMSNERTEGSDSFNMKKISDTMSVPESVSPRAETWGVDREFRDKVHVLDIANAQLEQFNEGVKTLFRQFESAFSDWIKDHEAKTYGVDLLGWYFFVNSDPTLGARKFMAEMNEKKDNLKTLWQNQLTEYVGPFFEEDEIHLYFDPWCTNKHEWDDFLVIFHALNYAANHPEKDVIMYFQEPPDKKRKGKPTDTRDKEKDGQNWLKENIKLANVKVRPMPRG